MNTEQDRGRTRAYQRGWRKRTIQLYVEEELPLDNLFCEDPVRIVDEIKLAEEDLPYLPEALKRINRCLDLN